MIRPGLAVVGFLTCAGWLVYAGYRGGVLAGCLVAVLIALIVFLEIKRELA